MKKHVFVATLAAAAALLAGCGVAETAVVTAAQAEAAVEDAKQAKETQAKIEAGVADAQQVAAENRAAAEEAGQ
jgi:hypothetical protein